MKRIVLLLYCLQSAAAFAQGRTDSLLKLLDAAIEQRALFAQSRERNIDSLKTILRHTTEQESCYLLYNRIFEQYKHYNLDSALSVAKEKNVIANKLQNLQYQFESRMNIAEMLGKMGLYKETFDILDTINPSSLDKARLGYYFHLKHSMFALLQENALSQEEKNYYQDRILKYKDSLLMVNSPSTSSYRLILNALLIQQGQFDTALTLMKQSFNERSFNNAEHGAIAYGISEIYEKMKDSDKQKEYLSIAALADIRRAVKSYIALRKLAVLLYQEGDIERAYAYIKCCMEDATFCKARFRMIEISEALPIIVATYDKRMNEEKNSLFKYLLLISALTIILFICIVLIYNQLRKISVARKLIKNTNLELMHTNTALKDVNKRLLESDHVKETYIGYVFNLCSSYINKLENYRVTLHKKLKARQIEEVVQITGHTSLVVNELKEFFQNFDAVFLGIYPNFVDEFNALLKTGEHILPKSGDILTPELRIYALSRLGVTDSSKIADFLHYSPQTVYNYKLKIKNKLAVSKEEFAEKIQQIGK